MALEEFSQEVLPEVEEALQETVFQDISEVYHGVREMISYHFGWNEKSNGIQPNGKRIRPLLVLLSAVVCGADWRKALPAAVSVELLHNFSLIHDDIEDNSDMRRGRESVWKIWGIPQAINTGDAMFSLAQLNMVQVADKVSLQAGVDSIKLLNRTCIQLTGGQFLDMSFESREDASRDEYFTMIGGKTAALTSACAELGAIAAQTSNANQFALRAYGEALGIAFQAWDDWLGIWGDENKTGKSASSDLLTKKKTLPVLYCLERGELFAQNFNQFENIPADRVKELVKMMESEGAQAYTEKIANHYTQLANRSLASLTVKDQNAFDSLNELTTKLLSRKN